MLINQLLNPRPSGYSSAIADATGAHRMHLPIIENIMRDVIFHSTLDWQTKGEFDAGAREAYGEYQSRSGFYDADFKVTLLSFQLAKAEANLAEVGEGLDRAIASGKPDRIARCEAEMEKRRNKRDELAEHLAMWKRILMKFTHLHA